MGHDISAQNKSGEMIAYLRYTMSDTNSYTIYHLLDLRVCHGVVSELGIFVNLIQQQIEEALKNYDENQISYPGNKEFEMKQQDDIFKFLTKCLDTTEKEITVQVFFG